MPQEEDGASGLDHPEEIFRVVFPANDGTTKVMKPGEQAFYFLSDPHIGKLIAPLRNPVLMLTLIRKFLPNLCFHSVVERQNYLQHFGLNKSETHLRRHRCSLQMQHRPHPVYPFAVNVSAPLSAARTSPLDFSSTRYEEGLVFNSTCSAEDSIVSTALAA